jgi:hypothetical protein
LGAAVPEAAAIFSPAAFTSASSRIRVAFLSDPRGDLLAQLVHALARAGAGGEDRDVRQAVGVEQAAYVGEHRLAAVGGHGVDVVEHHDHHVAWDASGLR